MRKIELEKKLEKHRADKAEMVSTLARIRDVSRNCINKGTMINPVWIIEKITETLTRIETKTDSPPGH